MKHRPGGARAGANGQREEREWEVEVSGRLRGAAAPHPRMTGEDRRLQLIETAIDLFSKKGFAGTTTREIAAAAGVNEAMIFRHFATKQDLYKAILDHRCNPGANNWLDTLDALMEANDDEGLVRSIVSGILSFHREDPRFQRLFGRLLCDERESDRALYSSSSPNRIPTWISMASKGSARTRSWRSAASTST